MREEWIAVKNSRSRKHIGFAEYVYRLLSVLLCLSIILSVFSVYALGTSGSSEYIQSRQETKARLLNQIKYEDWDPYSSDMTVE